MSAPAFNTDAATAPTGGKHRATKAAPVAGQLTRLERIKLHATPTGRKHLAAVESRRMADTKAALTSLTTKSGRSAHALRKGVEGQHLASVTPISEAPTRRPMPTRAPESTPIYSTLIAKVVQGAEFTGSAMAETTRVHWLTELFETPEQRRLRLNTQVVASGISLLASGLSFAAKRAAKK